MADDSRRHDASILCARCGDEGWLCEAHSEVAWPHGVCDAPGIPCPLCNTGNPPRLSPGFESRVRADRGVSVEEPFYTPGKKPAPPRQPQPSEEVWRLRGEGRVQSCELCDNSRLGAGWDVMLLENGEPLFSRRCADERLARYVAASTKKDLLRTGWVDDERRATE